MRPHCFMASQSDTFAIASLHLCSPIPCPLPAQCLGRGQVENLGCALGILLELSNKGKFHHGRLSRPRWCRDHDVRVGIEKLHGAQCMREQSPQGAPRILRKSTFPGCDSKTCTVKSVYTSTLLEQLVRRADKICDYGCAQHYLSCRAAYVGDPAQTRVSQGVMRERLGYRQDCLGRPHDPCAIHIQVSDPLQPLSLLKNNL